MMKKAAAIGIILAMALSLGACGEKSSSGPASQGAPVAQSASQETSGDSSGAVSSGNASGTEAVAGANETELAGANVTGVGGANMTGVAGGNMTAAVPTSMPVMLDPPSMKTAYKPETEDEKYARELTGVYLLTDLKDAKSADTEAGVEEQNAEGKPMYLEFYSNGTMRETVFGDPIGGLWDKEYLTIGADRVPYEKNGDHLTVSTENMKLTFTRTSQEELDLLLASGSSGGVDDSEENTDAEDESEDPYGEYGSAGTATEQQNAYTEIVEYLFRDDLCAMAVTGYDFSDPRGFMIRVRCENYSIYTYDFNLSGAVVNNVMFDPVTPEGDIWSMEVAPQSDRDGEILFPAELAAEYGITSFDYVLLNLWVHNVDQWMDDPVYSTSEDLYPTGKVTGEGIQSVKRRAVTGEKKIAEDNKFTFTILQSEKRENGDFVLRTCIENNSYQSLMFSWDDVYVNGNLLDPFWAAEVLPHTISYEDIVFTASDLQRGGVNAVSDVTFTMTAYDSRDWLSYAFYTKTSQYRVF